MRRRGRSIDLGANVLACVLAVAVGSTTGCGELRGRRKIREGNRLYRDGQYAQAVEQYAAAEAFVPQLATLWLNKGLACRQLMIPGAKTAANDRAVTCAVEAFDRLRKINPADGRGEQLYLQTLFDADRFETLAAFYGERLRKNASDVAALNGLIQVYSRWNRMEEALATYRRRAAVQSTDPEAQYAVGVFIWQELLRRGGGADKMAFDPRASSTDPHQKPSRQKQPQPKEPPQKPPSFALGDITGAQRASLADVGIAYVEKALALRPRYREAAVYLNLLYRQKSFAYFDAPDKWQACIDAAERWRRQAEEKG